MAKVAKNLTELIGNTPLLELSNFNQVNNTLATIIAKLEFFNPGSSVKDRIGYSMIKDAEENGLWFLGMNSGCWYNVPEFKSLMKRKLIKSTNWRLESPEKLIKRLESRKIKIEEIISNVRDLIDNPSDKRIIVDFL